MIQAEIAPRTGQKVDKKDLQARLKGLMSSDESAQGVQDYRETVNRAVDKTKPQAGTQQIAETK